MGSGAITIVLIFLLLFVSWQTIYAANRDLVRAKAWGDLLRRALRLRVLPTDRLRQTARRCSRPLARTPGARLYLPFVGRAAARGPALFDLQLLVHSVHFAGKAG